MHADSGNGRIRRVDEAAGIITTAAGSGDGGSPEQVALAMPRQVSVDAPGHLYVADGVYVYRLTSQRGSLAKPMVRLK